VLALQAARGWARPHPAAREQDELVEKLHRGARHPPADPELPVAQPVRRQPAEGAARALAHHRAAAADPRRADPRHRRRRQGRDPARSSSCRRGHGGAVHLRRAGGGAALSHRIVVLRDRARSASCQRRQRVDRRSRSWRHREQGARVPSRIVTKHRLFWPRVALLVLLLLVNARLQPPAFFSHRAARRPPLRQPDRHPAQRRAADAGRARHDAGDRHPRHRPVGRRGGRHRRRGGLPDIGGVATQNGGTRRAASAIALALGAAAWCSGCGTAAGRGARHPADHRHADPDGRRAAASRSSSPTGQIITSTTRRSSSRQRLRCSACRSRPHRAGGVVASPPC
jgi:hypothetical protein